jgi:hypothetical protein
MCDIPAVPFFLAAASRDRPATAPAPLRAMTKAKTILHRKIDATNCVAIPREGATNAVISEVIFWGRTAPLLATRRFCALPAVLFRPGFVLRLLRRPFYQAEDNRLVVLRIDRAPEIGHLSVGHVVAPAFDDAQRAILLELEATLM